MRAVLWVQRLRLRLWLRKPSRRRGPNVVTYRTPGDPGPRVELLWFADCPNHESARRLLADVLAELAPGVVVEDVDATDPAVARQRRFPGSPTIRVDGRDVDPSFRDPGDYTPRCRLYWTAGRLAGVPERHWIEAAIRDAVERRGQERLPD